MSETLSVNAINPLCLNALIVAKGQLGVTEIPLGSNKGPNVKAYLASVGLNEGYSWCAAFVYWCFQQAAYTMKIPNPLYKTGGVLKHWQFTKGIKVKMPRPGDIGILDHGNGMGHEVLVKTVDAVAKTYTTVEGNSDANGSRTGGMVCSNTRKISAALGFIRY